MPFIDSKITMSVTEEQKECVFVSLFGSASASDYDNMTVKSSRRATIS